MSTLRLFQVEAGNDHRRVLARSYNDALRKAWKRNPPRHMGFLIRARATGKPWQYLDVRVALKIAGYKIEMAK